MFVRPEDVIYEFEKYHFSYVENFLRLYPQKGYNHITLQAKTSFSFSRKYVSVNFESLSKLYFDWDKFKKIKAFL